MTTSERRRWLALAVVCLAQLMITLDTTIVNVALGRIQSDLHFTQSNLTWVINAFLVTFGSFLLLAGRLGDLVGRRRVFLAGVGLFTLSSILCGLATDAAMLIGFRFLQGIGAAMQASVILAIIVAEFREPAERTRAMSAYVFAAVAGGSLGLLAGGLLTQLLNWHWIFFINVPIGVVAIAVAVRVLESDRGPGLRAGADALGAVLVTAALMLGVYTIVETGRYGWWSVHTIGLGTVVAVLLAAFVVRQAKAARPL
ncbi:MAG: MFS transporter, partial [Solirubrobacteraceae bacterium]